MTVLTGKLLQETAKDVWGDNWIAILSKRLHLSKRTIQRYRDEISPMSPEFRSALLEMIETQMAILGERRNLLAQEWDDA